MISHFITKELDPIKCLFALQNELLTQFSQMHRIVELPIGDRTVDKVLGKGKITVIGTISDDGIL